MKFMMKMTAFSVLGFLFFAGCGAKKDRTEKKLGPAESITHFTKSIADDNGFQVWASLPKSWRTEINGLARMLGDRMPDGNWDRIFALVGRAGFLLERKASLFIEISGAQQLLGMSKPATVASLKDLGKALTILANSKIATVKSLQTVDLADVIEGELTTIDKILAENRLLDAAISKDMKAEFSFFNNDLLKIKAKLISEKDDKAKVLVTFADAKTKEVEMTKIEGKWLPVDMVQVYTQEMPKMKKAFAKKYGGWQSSILSVQLSTANSMITSLEKAKSADEIKATFSRYPYFSSMANLTVLGYARAKVRSEKIKKDLKMIASLVASHFADGTERVFPASFKGFKWRKDKGIDFSKYVFLAKEGDTYTAGLTKPWAILACEKPDPSQRHLWVVYESGHVEMIRGPFSTVEQVRIAAKR